MRRRQPVRSHTSNEQHPLETWPKMEWSKDKSLQLIRVWETYPSLWHPKYAGYKYRLKRRDDLINLSKAVRVDVVDIEKKLQNFKSQYKRELMKFKAQARMGAEGYVSKWYAFEYLYFLRNVHGMSDSSSVKTAKFDYTTSSQSEASSSQTLCNEELIDNNFQTETQSSTSTLNERSTSTINARPTPEFDMELIDPNVSIENHHNERDELSTFGEFVASEMRGIKGQRNILIVKKQIQDIIFNAKMACFDKDEHRAVYSSAQHSSFLLKTERFSPVDDDVDTPQ